MAVRHSRAFGTTLGPVQLGVGLSRGPQIFALAVRLALESSPGSVVCKLDFKNAFNMCSRRAFLRYTARHFPALLLFLLAAYGAPPYITALGPAGWVRFLSRRGTTQGCPLGPYCFAAALQPVLQAVARRHACLTVSIHDDVQLAGPPEVVLAALRDIITQAREHCGLEPTGHKFGLYVPVGLLGDAAVRDIEAQIEAWTPAAALARGERCVAQSAGVVAAGVPLGEADYVRGQTAALFERHAAVHEACESLRDTQAAYLLLRYSLSQRIVHWLGLVGSTMSGAGGPIAVHDERLRRSLAALLVDPTAPGERRGELVAAGVPLRVWEQAQLSAARGGLSLAGGELLWAPAQLACGLACVPYVREHAAFYGLEGLFEGGGVPDLPFFADLRAALARLHELSSAAVASYPTLDYLLSGSPRSLHDLAEGVYVQLADRVLQSQPGDRHRARFLSAGGLGAGAWLGTFPITVMGTARARHFQLALLMRVGGELPELAPVRGWQYPCGARVCGGLHDSYGFHPGTCRAGNRYGLWTLRHDAVQLMLVYVVRRLGFQALSCSAGAGNWFGAAGWRAGSTGYRRADVVMPHHLGMGRHLFLDVAVTDPGVGAALTARPSPSSSSSGVAAELRAQKKVQKYEGLAAAVDSSFCPAVIERYGAVCDALLGFLRGLCGDGERCAWQCEDHTFSQSSRQTYALGLLGFAAVVSDAALLERVVSMDTQDAPEGRYVAPAGGGRGGQGAPPTPRQVEGLGGHFWYEAR